MRIGSRHVVFGLLALVLALALLNLLALAGTNEAVLGVMNPGAPASKSWRLAALASLALAGVAGVMAFTRLLRADRNAPLFAASAALLATLGSWAADRMTGIPGVFQLPILLSVVTAGAGWWTWYRDGAPDAPDRYVSVADVAVWVAALLDAGAILFLLNLGANHSPQSLLRAVLLATPQWITAWRLSSSWRLSRWDAGLATAVGVGGICMLALITVWPIAYVGFLGLALLRQFWGVAFYAALGTGSWIFVRAGAELRRALDAPRRDGVLAIVAGCLGLPLLMTVANLLRLLRS